MGAGFEAINDSGNKLLLNEKAINFFAMGKGVVGNPDPNSPIGTSGFVSLPAQSLPYLVFIRTSGQANAFATSNGFNWRMGQGTGSFEWWAFRPGQGGGNAGLQAFNPDGTIQWDCTDRPLRMVSVLHPGDAGAVPTFGEMSTENVRLGPGYGFGRTDLAYAISDLGMCHDVYFYNGGGPTLRANMRYQPMISNRDPNHVYIDYCRTRANRTAGVGNNTSYTAFRSQMPNFLMACRTW